MSMVIVEGLETQTLGNGDTRTGGDADGNKSLDTDARRDPSVEYRWHDHSRMW